MKTAVFFLSPSCGGAERMTITIAKLLDRNEYDVRFIVIGRQIGEIKEFFPDDYPVLLVKIRNIYDFTTLRVYNLLRKIRPQFVFCSLHYLNPRVIQATKWIGNCKVIIRFNCAVNRVQGVNKWLTQITYPKADVIIAQTENMQEDLEYTYPSIKGKVVTMHNLIDTDTIELMLKNAENPYKDEHNKVFVWVGRFDPVKGADLALKAFIKASQIDEHISLYMVGKVDEKNEHYQIVHNIADSSSCKERIHFVGFQENPYKWIKNANCFILSSRSEGSPNALFEALYLGVPSAVTRCTPNIDDIVDNGFNGYKVPINDVEELSKAMLKAIELGKIKSIYIHSTKYDYISLFL